MVMSINQLQQFMSIIMGQGLCFIKVEARARTRR